MQGEQGVVARVKLPSHAEQQEYDKLELDFTLSCPGDFAGRPLATEGNIL